MKVIRGRVFIIKRGDRAWSSRGRHNLIRKKINKILIQATAYYILYQYLLNLIRTKI